MPKYELSKDAEKDLFEIAVFGDLTFGEAQSDKYNEGLKQRFNFISENPLLYPFSETNNGNFRKCVHKSHSIYYEITQSGVFIVRIIGQQDF